MLYFNQLTSELNYTQSTFFRDRKAVKAKKPITITQRSLLKSNRAAYPRALKSLFEKKLNLFLFSDYMTSTPHTYKSFLVPPASSSIG